MKSSTKAAIKSYARALGTAVLAVAVSGVNDWMPYVACFVVAVLAPLARSLDVTDPAFGRVVDVIEHEAESKIVEATKAARVVPPALPKG